MDNLILYLFIIYGVIWFLGSVLKKLQNGGTDTGKREPSIEPPERERPRPAQGPPPEGDNYRQKELMEKMIGIKGEPPSRKIPPSRVARESESAGETLILEDLFKRTLMRPAPRKGAVSTSGKTGRPVNKRPDIEEVQPSRPEIPKKSAERTLLMGRSRLTPLQEAVVLHEILGPPRALRKKEYRGRER